MELILTPALPCDKNGNYLPLHTKPSPLVPIDATDDNAWHPFDDRLAFDFANFQFSELQASESKINRALDLWMAANLKAGGDESIPWSSAEEMYATIDAIQEGNAPWRTITFKYNGLVQQSHRNGCFSHMNFVRETLVKFYTSNLRREILQIKSIMFRIANLQLMVTVYGQTWCLRIGLGHRRYVVMHFILNMTDSKF